MIKFTKEEISLCKQVAERWRKPLKIFDPVIGTYLSGEEFIGYFHEELTKEKSRCRLDEVMVGLCETAKSTNELIPLWTISDCLEFLREKGWLVRDLIEYEGEFGTTFLYQTTSEDKFINGDGKTALEAFLKAVLAVLEEGK